MGYVWVNEAEAAREAVRIAREAVEEVANALRNRLVQLTPRDSGRTANAWTVEIEVQGLQVIGRVYNQVEAGTSGRYVWELLHEGTGRFGPSGRDIVPVRRQAMRWRGGRGVASGSGSGYVFAKRVKGSPPDDFIVRAVQEVSSQFPGWTIRLATPPGGRVVGA